jgi:hypothetical protein
MTSAHPGIADRQRKITVNAVTHDLMGFSPSFFSGALLSPLPFGLAWLSFRSNATLAAVQWFFERDGRGRKDMKRRY